MVDRIIEIDGSEGEAGGQVIRTALTLSAITKKPVRIFNIRAKRPKPGLQAQHLTAVKAVRNICRGTIEGAELLSKELTFTPGEIIGGRYEFNIGTAGSVVLVAQTLLPILLFAEKKSELIITGGTHVIKSPSYDYFEKIFLRAIKIMGVMVESKIIRTGYYPRGGGQIEIVIEPSKLIGISGLPNEMEIHTIIRISNIPLSVAIREKKVFVQNNINDVKIIEENALDAGNALLVWCGLNGVYALGEKGKRAEIVAQEAVDQLKKENNNVDKYLADQLLIYAVLADGQTTFRTSEITEHFKTNVNVISKFINRKITLEENTKTIAIY